MNPRTKIRVPREDLIDRIAAKLESIKDEHETALAEYAKASSAYPRRLAAWYKTAATTVAGLSTQEIEAVGYDSPTSYRSRLEIPSAPHDPGDKPRGLQDLETLRRHLELSTDPFVSLSVRDAAAYV